MYISEISPISLRGSMGVCHQMAITVTILLSQFLGLDIVCVKERGREKIKLNGEGRGRERERGGGGGGGGGV